ncbi:MAG: hypothetical protein LBD88_03780 [Candidatus Peribacteria bacterium]|jgi:hypothetical protein|nr:hypothetical protein [Candidatus Peribacteria bacterium]
MKKIIITEFFTTVSFSHFFTSLSFIILGFPFIRKGNSVNKVEKAFLGYLEEPEMYYSGKNKTPHSFRNKELFHCINQKQNKKNKKILSFYN